jgi:phosphoglycolate phosphatase
MHQPSSSVRLIFDFDGTIADTMDLVLTIYNQIAPEYGCTAVNREDKKVSRTQKPRELLKNHGVTITKLPRLILRMHKEIGRRIAGVKPFDGITDALDALVADGFALGIVTSNAVENVHAFLHENALVNYFSFVWSGTDLFGKDRIIRKLMRKKCFASDTVIYIGDEMRDIEAVRKIGIPIVSVTWGYSSRDVLMQLHPDQMADIPGELHACVLQLCRTSDAKSVQESER